MSENNDTPKGLAKVEKCYHDYSQRARELKEQGERVMSFICAFVPVEIIAAAGFFPLRLKGDVHEPVTKGDTQLEAIACPFVRSLFDLSVKGRYNVCDGIIIPHACDSITTPYNVWKYTLELPYSHFVNLPRKASAPSIDFFKSELTTFRNSLANFAGTEITDEALARYVMLYNENRSKIRALYEFRKEDPPLISGGEVTRILVAAMSLPVDESNRLLDEVISEIKERKAPGGSKLPRLMVVGGTVDNCDFINLVEDSGSNVVVDNTCIGTRDFWPYADVTDDPMDGITRRYLDKINCPRTARDKVGTTFQDDLDARYGDVAKLVRDFKVDGVIHYIYRYCDPFGFEIPARKAHLESLKTPVLYLEDNYAAGTIGGLRTRIQAFIEMIEG